MTNHPDLHSFAKNLHKNFELALGEILHKFYHSPKCKDSHFFFLFLNLSKLEPARVSELANPYLLIQLLDHAGKDDKGRKKTLQASQNLTQLTGGCSRYAEHPMTRLSRFTKPNFTVLLGRKGPGFSNHRRHNIGSFKLFGVLVLPGGFTFCWQAA